MSSAKALGWIINFLESNSIPYLICGGLAAIAYGAKRPLNDIDLYVPDNKYADVIEFGREYISYGPERLHNEYWNVEYVQFVYMGQKIEVGSDENLHIYDSYQQKWVNKNLDFTSFNSLRILDRVVRVMNKAELISYKTKLGRRVDILDIEEISKLSDYKSS